MIKGFDQLQMDASGEIKAEAVEPEPSTPEPVKAAAESRASKMVDRRPSKPAKAQEMSLDEKYMEQAQRELSLEGKEFTPQDVHDQALRIKFRGMQSNTVENKAIDAYVAEAFKQFSADMATPEARLQREKEHAARNAPDFIEVIRVKGEDGNGRASETRNSVQLDPKEIERRAEQSRKTAEAIRLGKEANTRKQAEKAPVKAQATIELEVVGSEVKNKVEKAKAVAPVKNVAEAVEQRNTARVSANQKATENDEAERIRLEKAEISRRTAEVIRLDKEKKRIEQERIQAEEIRVAKEAKEKVEKVPEKASKKAEKVKKPSFSIREIIMRNRAPEKKPELPMKAENPVAAEKGQEQKAEKPPEPKTHRSIRDIIMGKK